METAIILSRCSKSENSQDVTRQTFDLKNKFSKTYKIVKVFEFYKSGLKNDTELETVLNYVKENKVQNILTTECSRICRRLIETLIFIKNCNDAKINVSIQDYNLNSLNEDKTENTMTTLIISIAANLAAMELKTTVRRLNSGRNKYIVEGGTLGRKVGYKAPVETLLKKHHDIVKLLKQGHSIGNIVKMTKKNNGTVQRMKKLISLKNCA